MSQQLKDITKEDWRILGFHYTTDDVEKKWIFTASKRGLGELCLLLTRFVNDSRNAAIGSHWHLGPYTYLTITTSDSFQIGPHRICGSIADLAKLSKVIESELQNASENTVTVLNHSLLDQAEYSIELRIMEYGYDPSRSDVQLWD